MKPLVIASAVSLIASASPAAAQPAATTAAGAKDEICKKELVLDQSGKGVEWGRVCIDRATLEARERRQREIERSRQYLNGVNGPIPNSDFGPQNYSAPPPVSFPVYVAPPNPSR
jgi:hypothetical protein